MEVVCFLCEPLESQGSPGSSHNQSRTGNSKYAASGNVVLLACDSWDGWKCPEESHVAGEMIQRQRKSIQGTPGDHDGTETATVGQRCVQRQWERRHGGGACRGLENTRRSSRLGTEILEGM